MSVYIRGMEMLRQGNYLAVVDNNMTGKTFVTFKRAYDTRKIVGSYEIVPVPPHGRLGDLDALVKRLESEKAVAKQIDNYDYWYALSVAIDFALAAPTIIPAEE